MGARLVGAAPHNPPILHRSNYILTEHSLLPSLQSLPAAPDGGGPAGDGPGPGGPRCVGGAERGRAGQAARAEDLEQRRLQGLVSAYRCYWCCCVVLYCVVLCCVVWCSIVLCCVVEFLYLIMLLFWGVY